MSPDVLLGVSDHHLTTWTDHRFGQGVPWRLHRDMVSDWQAMLNAAEADGISILPISAYRDFSRQALIFNEKAEGRRGVHDDHGQRLQREAFSDEEWLHRILRFSALPGLSRHHWGTDLDVFDANAVHQGHRPKLESSEFSGDGPCVALNEWLQENAGRFGFFRPYRLDLGGVAPEPWHLSYAPISRHAGEEIPLKLLAELLTDNDIAFCSIILPQLPALVERYAQRISPP